jgi:DinB superfamily
MVEAYLSVLELGYYEVKEAFKGLADEHVWKRPAEGLLSVGELAGHIAHWEAVRLAGEGGEPWPDLAKCRVSSPLIDERFRYYPLTLANPPSEQHLAMTAEQVCGELLRVHEEAVAHFRALNPDLASNPPGWPSYWTYGESLKYAVFHVSYHTGQIYSVRHLLGEETPDN